MHCLKMHVLAAQKKQTNVHACFQLASNFKSYYRFCSFLQTMGLPSFLRSIFAGNASSCSCCTCSTSVMFVWSCKVVLSEKQSHMIIFYVIKMALDITVGYERHYFRSILFVFGSRQNCDERLVSQDVWNLYRRFRDTLNVFI